MPKSKRLDLDFYLREDVVQVSKDLLGKVLVTNIDGILTSGMITETEAYRGLDDKASHAYNGRRTARTEVMFHKGGVSYVYLIYGIHHLFNVVIGPAEVANAVLIRAIEPVDNLDAIMARRNMFTLKPQLTFGPGVLSKALGITTQFSGHSLVEPQSQIWLEDRGQLISPEDIIASPRVGIPYAEEAIDWPWRFRIKNSKWVGK